MYKKRRFLIPEGFLLSRQRFNELCCLENITSLIKLGKISYSHHSKTLYRYLREMCWFDRYRLCNLRRNRKEKCGKRTTAGLTCRDSFPLWKSMGRSMCWMRRCEPAVPRPYKQLGQCGVALPWWAAGEGAHTTFGFHIMPRISPKFIYRTHFQNLSLEACLIFLCKT